MHVRLFWVRAAFQCSRRDEKPAQELPKIHLHCDGHRNISYLLVVDKSDVLPQDGSIPNSFDLATLSFNNLWQDDHQAAARAMAAVIAVSILGNLWVMTFTAARVKQEIAKEGILPFSLIIATSYRTPYGMFKNAISGNPRSGEQVEQAPTAAFGLHWLTSVALIAVTAPIVDPRETYSFLVSLYSYTIILVLGFWVSFGLLLTKLRKSQWHWQDRRRYRPWLSPIHAVVYCVATAFMLITAFVPPQRTSPLHASAKSLPWYIVPTIGITGPFWGVFWYWGFRLYESKIKFRQLVVTRQAYWVRDPECAGEYVQLAEIVDHTWEVATRGDKFDGFEKQKVAPLQPHRLAIGHQASPLDVERTHSQLHEDGAMAGRGGGIQGRLPDSF